MIKDVLAKHGFSFNKQFGQNFITDANLLSAIVNDAGVTKTDTVIEIGAGAGTLTKALSDSCRKVISFEIDRNLMPVLNETLANSTNVEIIIRDVMKTPMAELEKIAGGKYRVVANLPYYITTPIIMNFVENAQNAVSLTVMVQKEVAERLAANSGGKDYGAITVAVQSVADIKVTRIVKRDMFFPSPNVDSAVVRMDFSKNKYDITNKEFFRKTVKYAFSSRRKQLQNNLSAFFDISKEKAMELIERTGADKNARAETLSVEQFVKLANLLYEEERLGQ
ncbi:MAG TPA: 16S rRNA (adenine(1518)-N(6)/adenine(1519)-N(6))-dimethyltransferase RsmA [Eubacteriales bacterium]|nr:16S rRNA (adenine(1518)-N(6)/adenine(1519)-N(6))-dimethyltransferase RsmA [Eubacteriales bacterium]